MLTYGFLSNLYYHYILFVLHIIIGDYSGNGVGPSNTPGPIYEEILPSNSLALCESKWSQKGFELQENTSYQVTTIKLEENTAYAVAAHKECKPQENKTSYHTTADGNLKDITFRENIAYMKWKDFELQENAAYVSK